MDSRHDSTISIRTYRRHVKRSNNTGDFFIFKRAYIKYGLLTITEAAFLQDLINLASMDKAEVDDNDWFLCSVNMLMDSMCWSADSQKDLFAKLITKGYAKTEKRGIPPKRWVWINIEKIEIDLDMKEDEKSQSGGKPPQQWGPPDQSGGKPPQRQMGKPPQYTLGEEEEEGAYKTPPSPLNYSSKKNKSESISSKGFLDHPQECYEWNDRLRKILHSRRPKWPVQEYQRKTGAKEFARLLKAFHGDKEKIETQLTRLSECINNISKPTIVSAKQFCKLETFLWLKDVMDKLQGVVSIENQNIAEW